MKTAGMSNFLVPDATLGIEAAAFLFVLFVVASFVLPRLRTAAQARQDEIQRGLVRAAAADELQRAADVEARMVLKAARHEAADITQQARELRDEIIVQGRRDGRAEYEWLAGRVDREMARRETLLRRQFELRATKAAVEAVGQTLGSAGVARLTAAIAGAMAEPAQSVLGAPAATSRGRVVRPGGASPGIAIPAGVRTKIVVPPMQLKGVADSETPRPRELVAPGAGP